MVRVLLFFLFTGIIFPAKAANRDWRGTISNDWNVAANWFQNVVPTAADDVFIGVTYAVTNQPAVLSGGTANCLSLTWGTGTNTLTVNGTLNVAGNILQRHNTGTGGVNTLITGTGTINCAGSLTVGHNAGNFSLNGSNTTTVKCNIALMRITGDLIANSSSFAFFFSFINNALFDLANDNPAGIASVIEVTGQVRTTNQTPITNTTAIVRISEPGNNLAILRMFNATPVSVQDAAYGAVDFYSATGGTGATAEYAATSGTQTVYTSATSGVGQNPSVYQNIRFSGAAIKLASSANSITIAGDWLSAGGNVNVVGAPVIFQGTTQALTDAGSNSGAGVVFRNVTFQTSGAKTINGTALQTSAFSISPIGTLTMAGTATLAVGTFGSLTLRSTSGGDARVAVIPTGCSITGNVSVQRFFKSGTVAANTRNYRLISSPVNANGVLNNASATANYNLSYLSNSSGVYTGGPGGPASGFTVANATPTIYLYKENLPASNASFNSGNFKGLTNIAGTTVTPYNDAGTAAGSPVNLPVGNGYMLYYVGNNVNNITSTTALNKQFRVGGAYIDPDASTATATGTLNQGTIPVRVYWSGSTTLSNAVTGFNLVGNPYASTIDWDTFSTATPTAGIFATGVGNSVYVFNYTNKNYGVYQAGTGGTGSNNASRYIASGQGFFVKASTASAALTFNEAAKSTAQPSFILMGLPTEIAQRRQLLRIRLAKDSVDTDESLILFEPGAANTDDDNDVPRLNGIGNVATLATYSKQGSRMLAINHQNPIDSTSRVRLHVAMTGAASRDTLAITGFDSLDPRYNCFLIDHYRKDSLQISTYGKYLFNIRPDSAATFGANRFELVFHKKADFNYRLLSFSALKTPDGIKLIWKTEREQDATGFVLQKADGSLNYIPLHTLQSNGGGMYTYLDASPSKGTNTYRLQQNDPFGKTSFSNPVSVDIIPGNADGLLVVYPNPVINDMRVQINAPDVPAKVQLRVIDFSGRALINKPVNGNNIQENLSQLTSGTYIIEIADTANQKIIGRTKISKP